jgi:NAD(P)-dependent dehydrogenase (short-subunit alcohol dehydrogenase family)
MPEHLAGQTAIVTGAGLGIGRGMAAQGASVIVNDFGGSVEGEGCDTTVSQQVVDEIRAAGGTAEANGADVSDHLEAEDLIRQALNSFGKLDILVNVAGILHERMIFNMTEQGWDDVIRVHLKGTYNTTHFASIHWRQRREYGRLINFSSTAGINGSASQPNYAAAKAGLIGFTKSCANALARYNVTANAIAAGAATQMTDRGLRNAADMREGNAESDVVADSERNPENVAPIVVYRCSEAGANISGRVVGASGYQVQFYSDMHVERQIFSDGPWNIDRLFERAPQTLFAGLEASSGDRPTGATVSDA